MKRTLIVTAALALAMALVGPAAAQTTPPAGPPAPAGPSFVDVNGDGICDNCTGTGTGAGQGQGKGKGQRRGPGNGTGNQGVGPQDGSGYGPGPGAACDGTGPKGRGRRGGRR
jgi:hypothetical protein